MIFRMSTAENHITHRGVRRRFYTQLQWARAFSPRFGNDEARNGGDENHRARTSLATITIAEAARIALRPAPKRKKTDWQNRVKALYMRPLVTL